MVLECLFQGFFECFRVLNSHAKQSLRLSDVGEVRVMEFRCEIEDAGGLHFPDIPRVCGAVQWRRHLGCKCIKPSDIAADSVRRRAALPDAETSVPAGLSEQALSMAQAQFPGSGR